jgi:hypothetical protein
MKKASTVPQHPLPAQVATKKKKGESTGAPNTRAPTPTRKEKKKEKKEDEKTKSHRPKVNSMIRGTV